MAGGSPIRFHDLRHTCITKLAESQASEHTVAIASHVSRKMIEHYSHIRMAAKCTALDAIAAQPLQIEIQAGVNQNVNQLERSETWVTLAAGDSGRTRTSNPLISPVIVG